VPRGRRGGNFGQWLGNSALHHYLYVPAGFRVRGITCQGWKIKRTSGRSRAKYAASGDEAYSYHWCNPVKAENKFGFPIEGTLEDWIGTQECPERFKIVSLKKTVNGVEEEGPRAAELDGTLVAAERRLPSCTLLYRVKRTTKGRIISACAAGSARGHHF
jgi:hypothetical protein